MTDNLAAIDVGTNSVHLVIARLTPGEAPDVLATDKAPVRLGSGGTDSHGTEMKHLSPAAVDRTMVALDRFRQLAEAHDAEVIAIATSAVREANDQAEFLRRARDEAGVDVQVISGAEEARLIHLGVLQAVPVADRRHLVIDIGGGSTEFVIGEGTEPLLARSLKLGHIRLTDRFFPDGIIENGAVKACRRHVKAFLAPLARDVEQMGFAVAVGSSGTIENVASMIAARRGDEPRRVANQRFTRDELFDLCGDITDCRTPESRASIPGLDEHRRDVIVGGVLLLRQIFSTLDIEEMIVSDQALREGILLDQLLVRTQLAGSPVHHLSDLRRSSVTTVARRYEEDLTHAAHSTELALAMFDQTIELHGMGRSERDVLEAAGLLHNVGRFISHAAHHKHSYYLVRHSEQLVGFTEHEIELIALVARYHRKSAPKPKHLEFTALDGDDKQRVRVLAGLLRIAIGLDRTYRGAVDRVRVNVSAKTITIEAVTKLEDDVELELFTARERSDLLADALDRSVVIDQLNSAESKA